MKTAKNAIGVSSTSTRARPRPINTAFADEAIGAHPLSPELRRTRKEWLANSLAREAQLAEIAGGGQSGCFEDGALDQSVSGMLIRDHGDL